MKNFTSYNRNILKRQVVLFILPVFAFVFSVQVAQAQAVPEVSWAMQFQGNSAEKNIIASDASGNVYVTGNFSGTVDFGDITLTSTGTADVFVAKVDASGTVLWAEKFEMTEELSLGQSTDIATDASGNVYTIGTFWGTVAFGSVTLTSDYQDVFVVKQDASGAVLWVSKFVSAGTNYAKGITVDTQGNIYTTGSFSGYTATFGDIELTRYSTGTIHEDTFVVKQNASGEVLWAKNFGATGNSGQNFVYSRGGITTDTAGNVYITGEFFGIADFDGTTIDGSSVDTFITKIDTSGEVIWAKRFGGPSAALSSSFGLDITVDAAGNVYVTGQFRGELNIGTTTLTTPYVFTPPNGDNPVDSIFVLKTDSSGNPLWGKGFIDTAGTGEGAGRSIAVDTPGNVYVTGNFEGIYGFGSVFLTSDGNDAFVLKMNSSGVVVWAERFGSTGSDEGKSITLGTNGSLYVAGNFQNTVDFGDTTLTALGYSDVFLVKLDENNLSVGQNLSKEWKVYPNPVKDILTIELPEAMQGLTLEVFNMLGQKVKEFILLDNIQHLDLSELTQGIYLLKADNNVIKIKKQD